MDEVNEVVNEIREKLFTNLEDYHTIIQKIGQKIYTIYKTDEELAAKLFLQLINLPIEAFRDVLRKDEKDLNYGSVAGIIREWLFYYIIDAAINEEKLKEKIKVFNNYSLPYKWKPKKGQHKSVQLDIAVGIMKKSNPKKLRRVFYCLEIKTNFDDGFEKYYEYEHMLYHQRTKANPDFRYHYIYFYSPPRKINNKIKILKTRKELWYFPPNGGDDSIEEAKEFLCMIYEPLMTMDRTH
jgi:hypothetical protein